MRGIYLLHANGVALFKAAFGAGLAICDVNFTVACLVASKSL